MLNRRELMAGAAALAATPAFAAPDVFADLSEALLADAPEGATFLGLDKGKRAGLKSKLTDQSWTHIAHDPVFCSGWLQKVSALPDSLTSGWCNMRWSWGVTAGVLHSV